MTLRFQDRTHAGRLLGAELERRNLGANAIVLALPRGGVPVGAQVAAVLHAPWDVIVVRKLGVPWQPELAMGAIAGGMRVLDHRLIDKLGITGKQIEAVIASETQEMERREKLYRGNRPALTVTGRNVILVDDGVATGSSMAAAARLVRMLHPQRLLTAVPVGTPEACERLAKETGECICLSQPEPFFSVGDWYDDFRQVSDLEVQQCLKQSLYPVNPQAN